MNKTVLTSLIFATIRLASAQPTNADALKTIDQLVEQNRRLETQYHQLEDQNQKLLDEITLLRQSLVANPGQAQPGIQPPVSQLAPAQTVPQDLSPETPLTTPPLDPGRKEYGAYTPNLGYKVADTRYGDLNVSIYSYARYLNQRGLNDSYTDAFGNVKNVQQRQDFQFQKVQIKFLGWIMSPKFRYFVYAWTNNTAQGQPAQVVLAGNLNYTFNKNFTLSAGITSLPGTRSVEGNFPFWFGVDSRLIADEFFRPSYTSGIWAKGQITKNLRYQAMIGNNLSTLGVSATQLDKHFNTFATALIWENHDYGLGYGDFEHHEKTALRFAAHFTRSLEDRQSQPDTESIANTQLRLSDGSAIFTPNLFGPGISITNANYKMTAYDAGLKYRGFSLDGTYYMRWLNHFTGPGASAVPARFDHGPDMQISQMLVPRMLQLYSGGSLIFGQYGTPFDARTGLNFFPWKNKVVRWNNEGLYLHKSPVGYTAVPFAVGGTGFVFHSTLELAF